MSKFPHKSILKITISVCICSFIINLIISWSSVIQMVVNTIGFASAVITIISFWSANKELSAAIENLRFDQKRASLSKEDLLDEMNKKLDEIENLI